MRPSLVVSVSFALVAASSLAQAEEPASTSAPAMSEAPKRPEKRESDAYPPPQVRWYTLAGGLGFTAAWWGLGAGTSYAFPDQSGITALRAPVIGPWRALATEGCDPINGCDFSFYFSTVWFALNGVAQAGGLAVALEALFLPTSAGGAHAPARPSPSAPPSDEGPGREAPPPSTQPPSNKPLFFLPQPVRIGQAGYGISFSGLF